MTTSSPPDEREWFHSREGRICGPTDPGDLAELIAEKRIPSDSLVWCRGMVNWRSVADALASGPPAPQPEGAKPLPWVPPGLPVRASGPASGDIHPGPLDSTADPARSRDTQSLDAQSRDAQSRRFRSRDTGSSPARGSYIAAHWRGEHSLARSFWLNHLLIAGLAGSVLLAAVRWADRRLDERPVTLLALVLPVLAIFLLVQAWKIAGTWRSARRSRGVLGRPVRAWIVRAFLRLDVVGTAGLLVALLVPHASAALSGMPFALPGATVRDQGRRIDVSGPITLASPAEFRRALAAAPAARLVRLSSPGGIVVAAREIAGAIRDARLDTEVVQDCASACTLAFFGGSHRTLHDGARLGFHSYSSTGMTPQAVVADEAVERRVYQAAGVPDAFVERMFSVPPNSVWYPSRPELVAAGFVTVDTPTRAPAAVLPAGASAGQVTAGLSPPAQAQVPPVPAAPIAPAAAHAPEPGTRAPGARSPEPGRVETHAPEARRSDAARRGLATGKGA